MWKKNFNKIIEIKNKEELSLKLYKDRIRSKYLAVWLKKLHKNLKKKHLIGMKEKF